MIHTFAERLRQEIADKIDQIESALSSGGVHNMEDYRYLVGRRIAHIEAIEIIDTLERAAEQE